VSVEDISHGCGSMYSMNVESPLFKGKSLVAQHKMVKNALKQQIADMHGLTLTTKASQV
jgi:BolA-like protein 3